ncbi:MAG: hypothetical protein EOP04_03320 [Proteobacteria bacterium]|nr:MAG: hypothetical protein EOP04_03320 [Pseudomonadota bacterium]
MMNKSSHFSRFSFGMAALTVFGSFFWLYLWIQRDSVKPPKMPVLKIDYPYKRVESKSWDPATASINLYLDMAQAIYSPLLEFDAHEQIKGGWVDELEWQDKNTLILNIRKDHRLSDGSHLTANDAALSLKRLAFLQQDSDNFYTLQFCHIRRLKSIHEACPGLNALGQTLTIKTRDPIAILPQLLSNIETSILPAKALEADGLTMRKFPIGSGPYSLQEDAQLGAVLVANPYHFNYRSNMPQTRRQLIIRFQDAVHYCLNKEGQSLVRKPTRFLFPPSSLGAFSIEEEHALDEERKNFRSTGIIQPLRIQFAESISQNLEKCLGQQLKDLPLALNSKRLPKNALAPDLSFENYDVSTYEELCSIRAYLSLNVLIPGPHGPERWLDQYLSQSDPEIRIRQLKEAYRAAIWDDPSIIPAWNFQVRAAIRKPWVMNFSPINGSNALHLIRYER